MMVLYKGKKKWWCYIRSRWGVVHNFIYSNLYLSVCLSMAYVPPHRRHNGAPARPSPSPEPLPPPQWKKKDGGRRRRKKIIYADHAFSTWFPVGMHMHDEYDEHHHHEHEHEHHPSLLPPLHLHVRPISLESVERKIGEKPLILVNTSLQLCNNVEQTFYLTYGDFPFNFRIKPDSNQHLLPWQESPLPIKLLILKNK